MKRRAEISIKSRFQFRFTTKFQRLLMVFGLAIACAVGMMRPVLGTLTVLFPPFSGLEAKNLGQNNADLR